MSGFQKLMNAATAAFNRVQPELAPAKPAEPVTKYPFAPILRKVLVHEGGYVNHPKDPGGATNKGVTQATYDGWRARQGKEPRSVRFITDEELTAIYRRDFWDKVRGDDLPSGVDYAVFDFAVNSGVSRAARYLQKVVGVAQDGKIGPNTLSAVRSKDPGQIVDALCDARLAFMRSLRIWPTFGKGWKRRVDDVRKVAKGMANG